MFARINTLEEYRAAVADKPEIREMDIGNGTVSFCYMISDEHTFNDAWAREARGICFDKASGAVTARPLHKFFNVNERESTRAEKLPWWSAHRVMDKRDGSMIHTVWTVDGIRFKSKKSFESDVAKAAESWVHSQPDLNVWRLANYVVAQGATAIFEWTAPDARIVLAYAEPELQLLHVRDNVSGAYWPLVSLQGLAQQFGVKQVLEFPATLSTPTLLGVAETEEGVEGWVIQFDGGEMVKLKTKWYLERHRAMTFLRERDIAEATLNESLDDLKSLLVTENVDISEVLRIEAAVVADINAVREQVERTVMDDQGLSRKDFAIKHGELSAVNGTFGLLMTRFLGKDPDYKDWYAKRVLKDKWTLRQLVLVPSVAEEE